MAAVLVLHEITTEREELVRALEAEGFTVVQAQSASEAVREIWSGNFLVAVISTLLTGTTAAQLQTQIRQYAPEIETLVYGRHDELHKLVRKVVAIRNGAAAA